MAESLKKGPKGVLIQIVNSPKAGKNSIAYILHVGSAPKTLRCSERQGFHGYTAGGLRREITILHLATYNTNHVKKGYDFGIIINSN